MEKTKKYFGKRSFIFSLIWGATYCPVVWLLKNHVFNQTTSLIIAIVPVITFIIFIYTYIKALSQLDEVKQRIQLEAVVIGFSLSLLLIVVLFLLSMCGISNNYWFGYANLVAYCMFFYFIGLFISKRKYAV